MFQALKITKIRFCGTTIKGYEEEEVLKPRVEDSIDKVLIRQVLKTRRLRLEDSKCDSSATNFNQIRILEATKEIRSIKKLNV